MKTKLLTLVVVLAATTGLWASNVITYMATDKLTAFGPSLNVGATTFGPAIISHTFSNGTGMITCSGEITTIGRGAFAYCSRLRSITIPNSVTTIGVQAFEYCSGLTSVTIPNSVTTIGDQAFGQCENLTSITIPNSVTTIGKSAFVSCRGLTSITIPNSVTAIGDYAFSGCSGLTSPVYNANCFAYMPKSYQGTYTIPNGITQIAGGAFNGCSGLTSVTIPNSVTTIGDQAFEYCSGLTSVTIPNSVTTIGDQAFNGCDRLKSVTIGNSVTTIGKFAFADCGLTSVTIPNSVTTIGDKAFNDCSRLTSVKIGYSVSSIGSQTFGWCYAIVKVTINSDALCSKWSTINHNFGTLFGAQVKDYIIGDSVKKIIDYTFYDCKSITSLTIGSSVKSIGVGTFCKNLTKVTINSNMIAASHGYYDSHNLSDIFGSQVTQYIFGNTVTEIGGYACYDCSNLTSITIPNSVTTIGDKAFYGCSGLTSVTIPNSVTTIGYYAFYNCRGLKKTNYTGTIADWCKIKFSDYDSNPIYYSHNFYINDVEIKDLVIPEGVETIGNYAFVRCHSLTSVTIPNSVTTIGDYAFNYCSGLKSITCDAITPPTCGSMCFEGVSKSIPVCVPKESVNAYKKATRWKEFANILPLEETDLLPLPYEGKDEIGSVKFIHNGQLLIERNGILYNAHGARVK